MMSLQPFVTAKEMWDYLKNRFVHISGAHLHTLMQGLRGLQQDDMTIDDYYSAFDHLMGPVLSMVPSSTAGCDGCSKKNTFIEQFMMYQFVWDSDMNMSLFVRSFSIDLPLHPY